MSGFEHYANGARDLEQALLRHGSQLGIDWNDGVAVAELAREAFESTPAMIEELFRDPDPRRKAKGHLFAVSVMMLRLMERSATIGMHTHGGVAWKAFGGALLRLSDSKALPPQ